MSNSDKSATISYIFWHWAYKEGVAADNDRPVSDYKEYDSSNGRNYNIFEAGETITDNSTFLKTSANGYDFCELNGSEVIGQKAWSRNWYRHKVYQQSWNKYNMKYYFEKIEQKESTSYPTASNSSETVSNIQKYVTYRAK